ncbi:MAG TPA: hypothetical protein VHD36_05795 [Pirellulales bacterium]|nr:hypothetical protein [Pirellulales bacterium]
MPEDRGTLRQVAWTELFPWLDLLRIFRLAIQARILLLSAAAVLLTFAGWWVAGKVFNGGDSEAPRPLSVAPWGVVVDEPTGDEIRRTPPGFVAPGDMLLRPTSLSSGAENPLVAAWHNLSAPFRQLFAPELSVVGLAYLLVCALWVDLIWSFFGGVITRLAALQYTRSERGSLRGAVRYVTSRYTAYVTAPLFPLFGVLLFVLPVALVGLIGHAGSVGLTTVAILWPLFLVAGLVIVIFLVGLLFGWPLMWPTISAEGTDSFDALSRSYSYVYQRPLHYLWFALVAGFLGALAAIVVHYFAAAVLYLTAWAVSWGAGGAVLGDLSETAPVADQLLTFWAGLVQLITVGFTYAFFLCAATIIYFLLRYEVDGTETDEVFVEEQSEKFGLPPVTTDAAGVAVMADAAAEDEMADNGADVAS